MYPLVKIPLFAQKDIYTFSKEEAKEYYKWFISIKSERLQILVREVQKMYPKWELDYTRNSLIKLYEWFERKVMYRNMNEEEKEQIKNQIAKTPLLVGVIDIPETTFTDETVSICFDISVYLGDALIFNVNGTKWTQKINSTNNIDYAQPLIVSRSGSPFNSRRVTESMAGSILDKRENLFSFSELFDDLVLKFSNS
ncbi:MAG: hypothetical protein WCK60_03605 [Candidatus Nomurabacteria bacterium]